jgi:hypothetical protein
VSGAGKKTCSRKLPLETRRQVCIHAGLTELHDFRHLHLDLDLSSLVIAALRSGPA